MAKSKSEYYTPPFTILIDSREQRPWSFLGLTSDAKDGNRPVLVHTRQEYLGDYQGDYQIEGLEDEFSIERKSVADFQSTLLGFSDGHRDRFEKELDQLRKKEYAAVIIEGSMFDVLADSPEYGQKTAAENAKILLRSEISLSIKHQVQFKFCSNRKLAEIYAFRTMEMFWRYTRKR